jgi:predicted DNA-binding ribbon-helix-helix protein
MAEEAGVPLARLVEAIDAGRGPANLSSALRLAVLDRLRSRLAAAGRDDATP